MSLLEEVHQEIKVCTKCELAKHRTRAVPGDGPEKASLLFLGEAPGWHEDQQGRPFVGPAGMFLEELLASIGMKRGEVFITNVVKCRPPGNRDPMPAEILACHSYLERQIEIIKPKMVVTLGRYSLAHFSPGEVISKVHGTARRRDSLLCYAMYHPAAALHQQSLRKTIQADMLKIPKILAETEKIAEGEKQPQQLSLF